MSTSFRAVCIILLGLGWGGLPTRARAAVPRVIVAFGDSTTAPRPPLTVYATSLEGKLNVDAANPVRVINAGRPGDTTTRAAGRFSKEVLAHHPHLVILQFGINDSMIDVWKDPPATESRVPVSQFEANLRNFIAEIRAAGAAAILMTPNPLEWTPALRQRYGKPPYRPEVADGLSVGVKEYAQVVRAVAASLDVPLVDVMQAHAEHAQHSPEPLLLDGMHPNQRGHDLVARLLVEIITARSLR